MRNVRQNSPKTSQSALHARMVFCEKAPLAIDAQSANRSTGNKTLDALVVSREFMSKLSAISEYLSRNDKALTIVTPIVCGAERLGMVAAACKTGGSSHATSVVCHGWQTTGFPGDAGSQKPGKFSP